MAFSSDPYFDYIPDLNSFTDSKCVVESMPAIYDSSIILPDSGVYQEMVGVAFKPSPESEDEDVDILGLEEGVNSTVAHGPPCTMANGVTLALAEHSVCTETTAVVKNEQVVSEGPMLTSSSGSPALQVKEEVEPMNTMSYSITTDMVDLLERFEDGDLTSGYNSSTSSKVDEEKPLGIADDKVLKLAEKIKKKAKAQKACKILAAPPPLKQSLSSSAGEKDRQASANSKQTTPGNVAPRKNSPGAADRPLPTVLQDFKDKFLKVVVNKPTSRSLLKPEYCRTGSNFISLPASPSASFVGARLAAQAHSGSKDDLVGLCLRKVGTLPAGKKLLGAAPEDGSDHDYCHRAKVEPKVPTSGANCSLSEMEQGESVPKERFSRFVSEKESGAPGSAECISKIPSYLVQGPGTLATDSSNLPAVGELVDPEVTPGDMCSKLPRYRTTFANSTKYDDLDLGSLQQRQEAEERERQWILQREERAKKRGLRLKSEQEKPTAETPEPAPRSDHDVSLPPQPQDPLEEASYLPQLRSLSPGCPLYSDLDSLPGSPVPQSPLREHASRPRSWSPLSPYKSLSSRNNKVVHIGDYREDSLGRSLSKSPVYHFRRESRSPAYRGRGRSRSLPKGYRNCSMSHRKGSKDMSRSSRYGYRDRSMSPRDRYTDESVSPRDAYRDRSQSPRDEYKDRSRSPRDGYRDMSRSPRCGYKDRSRSPRDGYRNCSRNGYRRRERSPVGGRRDWPNRRRHRRDSQGEDKGRRKPYRKEPSPRENSRTHQQQQAMKERRVLYVGGIPNDYIADDLQKRFYEFGEIEDITLHFRQYGDNYGFVTFRRAADAAEAKERGNDGPGLSFSLCFGGRRMYCDTEYADLDGCKVVKERLGLPNKMENEEDFDSILSQRLNGLKDK